MNVKDIPDDMMQEIRLRFESTPEVRSLRTRQEYAQRQGRYMEALRLAETAERLFPAVLNEYMAWAEREMVTFDTGSEDLPQKDRDEMMEKLMVLFMACDIIDSAVIDLNDVLHRTRPDMDITTFNDIRQMSDMARKKLQYLQKNGDYMQDLVWADKCDNMYEMMQSKARGIIRKRAESKDWGENMKRVERGERRVES